MSMESVRLAIRGTDAERVLLSAYANGGTALPKQVDERVDQRSRAESAQQLRDYGLAHKDASLAGEVTLTSTGWSLAEQIQVSRHSGADRSAKVQRGLLRWLKETAHPSSTEDFEGAPHASAWGAPFTRSEIEIAAEWLLDRGLIKGVNSWGGSLARPTITSFGREVLDASATPVEFVRGGSGSVTHDNSSTQNFGDQNTFAAIQSGGQGNTQSEIHVTINQDQRQQVFEKVDAILDELSRSDPDNSQGYGDVKAIRDEAESPGATRESLLSKIMSAVITAGTVTAVREGLMALASLIS